jgi:two-component system nitrate/nitrite response regulator NarL
MPETINKIKIRVLLADDHPVVRAGIRSFLSSNDNMEIVGEAEDGREAVSKARELQPDVVFMDTYMPRMNGLEATKVLNQQVPAVKVLMHSVHNSHECVLQIIRSGARGYVLKNGSLEELSQAIERVNQGDTYYNSEVARLALDEHSRNIRRRGRQAASDLSEREAEVLSQIAEGKSNREIAGELGIGVRTIETHRERIMQKLQVHNVAGLIKLAIAHGVAAIE